MVPTAQEFIESQNYPDSLSGGTLEQALIDFAKMHCEAQVEAIEESAYIVTKRDKFRNITSCKINRESIVTAYPLENIK